MLPGPPRWIDVGGVPTRFFDAGQGEPILLITGGNFGSADAASTVEIWHRNVSVLAVGHRVLVLDKLGQGHTGNPPDDDYRMQAVVRHALGFVAALDLHGIHLVGQSRGAMLAARIALECPARVRSCTLVNTGTLSPGVGLNEVMLSACPFPPATRDSQRWLFEHCAADPTNITDDLVESGFEVMQLPKYQEAVRRMTVDGLGARLFLPHLARLKQETLQWIADRGFGRPTQIIWGRDDTTVTLDAALELFRMAADRDHQVGFHLINDAGHHPFLEHPAQFNEIVLGFLRTLQS